MKKIKIGILTFHRAHNYGAILQCYALQETLRSLDYDVQIIDYRQPYIEKTYQIFGGMGLFRLLIHPFTLLYYLNTLSYHVKRKFYFSHFRRKYIRTTLPCVSELPQDFDVYLIGSDQLWTLPCTNGMDKFYFGSFKRPQHSKLMSYAISSNEKSISQIDISKLKNIVNLFDVLSFREEYISSLVEHLSGRKNRIDIDPTLLQKADFWKSITNDRWKSCDYVLLYEVRKPQEHPDILSWKAKLLAETLNCKVIDLSQKIYSPEDFVSLFMYARYVVTSSFHATVFALIFQRPLYAVRLRDGQDIRYESILKILGADSMLVELDFPPVPQVIDYEPIMKKMETLRSGSLQYLKAITNLYAG